MAKLKYLKCSLPGCTATVGQHSKVKNKNKTFCAAHRTTKKAEADKFKMDRGCENVNGKYEFNCVCSHVRVPESLDINHIDGNNDNRDPSNIEVLCRMCHSEITIKQEHHLSSKKGSRELELSDEAKKIFVFS